MILIELFLTFLKIGAFTFGGGYAMIPLMQSEAERHQWITQEELVDFIAVSESTPGPLAVNMATFIGIRKGGILGALCATSGVILPSFIIILIVVKYFEKFRKNKAVSGIMNCLKPAVIGMIASSFLSVGITAFFPDGFEIDTLSKIQFWTVLVIFILSAVFAFKKIHPITIIVLSAVIGIIAGYGFNFA